MKTIEYKVSFEKMVSRLPGLFAYLESDEYGEVSLHKATDSLDGCWGKVVENIKLPNGINLEIEDKQILEANKVYSFRTIIDYFYQYRNILEENDPFVSFIERGIGKIKVDFIGKEKATPEYIYLSNAKSLYNELVKMKKMCDFYHENEDKGLIEEDSHMCCLCERYKDLGGDAFKEYVGDLISEAERIADEYYGYAHNEIVIKNCNGQEITKEVYNRLTDKQKECCEFILPMALDFHIDLVSTYQDFGIMSPYAPQWIPGKRYYKGDNVVYDDILYSCKTENTGKWDDDLLTIVFDYDKFEKVADFFNDNPTPQPLDVNFPIQIGGGTDSKLINMRRFETYYNDDGVAERPLIGEDWLFYYRKGMVVNIKTINDNLGNVVKLSNLDETSENPNDLAAYGDVIENIIPNTDEHTITFVYRIGVHLKSEENPTIVHDDDNNKLIKWKKFVWDGDTEIGIKYTETYNYEEGSDIDKLINNNFEPKDENDAVIGTFLFDDYINGLYEEMIPTYKFEFITINNTFNYNKTIAHQDVNIISLLTNYELVRNDFSDFAGCKLFREDYFNGITFKPTKDIDVHIERGSTSVFDKHIAFGEIKTMEDMEQHSGKIFSMNIS